MCCGEFWGNAGDDAGNCVCLVPFVCLRPESDFGFAYFAVGAVHGMMLISSVLDSL